jgi:hypothetical protein
MRDKGASIRSERRHLHITWERRRRRWSVLFGFGLPSLDGITAALLVGVLAPELLLASPAAPVSLLSASASAGGPDHVPVAKETGAMVVWCATATNIGK